MGGVYTGESKRKGWDGIGMRCFEGCETPCLNMISDFVHSDLHFARNLSAVVFEADRLMAPMPDRRRLQKIKR